MKRALILKTAKQQDLLRVPCDNNLKNKNTHMKKLIFCISIITLMQTAGIRLYAQNVKSYELGSGINFGLNDGAYQFKISGMILPAISVEKMSTQTTTDNYFNVQRCYFNFSGTALKEKVSFFLQTDFSLGSPLLDAWLAYKPINGMTITAGQMQSISNNREMLVMEDKLQFADRSLLSTAFSKTGREFGVFAVQKLSISSIGIVPQVSVTSGDGRNSFGVDSRDTDLGGLKYNARIDLYPLGYFAKGNDDLIADLVHEKDLKFVIGGAASYNTGVSNVVGEGHGDFQFYNQNGAIKLPDYRKIYGDILFKFRGISLLGEFVKATATNLDGSYTAASLSSPLIPTQISEYLALGSAYNAQIGYVTKDGYALDVRYSELIPEFANDTRSIISKTSGLNIGFSKYFKANNLKLQASFTSNKYADNSTLMVGSLGVQVVF
jgi:hypothetical protein